MVEAARIATLVNPFNHPPVEHLAGQRSVVDGVDLLSQRGHQIDALVSSAAGARLPEAGLAEGAFRQRTHRKHDDAGLAQTNRRLQCRGSDLELRRSERRGIDVVVRHRTHTDRQQCRSESQGKSMINVGREHVRTSVR